MRYNTSLYNRGCHVYANILLISIMLLTSSLLSCLPESSVSLLSLYL